MTAFSHQAKRLSLMLVTKDECNVNSEEAENHV